MADLGENASASEISENIGDVLASIRRLIAQDEANRSVTDPGQRLRQVAIDQAEVARNQPVQASQAAPRHAPQSPPLMLGDPDMVPPQGNAKPPMRPRPANESRPLRIAPEGGPTAPPPLSHGQQAATPHRMTERRFPAPPPMQPATLRPEHLTTREPRPFQQREMRPDLGAQTAPAAPRALTGDMAGFAGDATAPRDDASVEAAAPLYDETRLPEPEGFAATPPALPQPDRDMRDDEGLSFVNVEEPAPAPASVEEELHLFAAPEDEMTTDRLLRNLIRDAVREELQGELGSQFSRNLRRLVRSEIDLALRRIRKSA